MAELKCPHCGEVFKVDESGYAALLQQVRTHEFEHELSQRLKDQLAAVQQKNNNHILEIKAEKDAEISELRSQLAASGSEQKAALTKAAAESERKLSEKDAEIQRLRAEAQRFETEKALAVQNAVDDVKSRLGERITALTTEAAKRDSEHRLALNEAVAEVEKQKQQAVSAAEKERDEQKIAYETQRKMKDEQIEQYRDFKARQSTKMVGESLERHCEDEFNKLRMTAFPTAYFEKDNDARTGSKGDYIYREERDGVEIVSIMFEMKNEMDTTASKHKNEHFFKELDKDRREKGCEYAVLVSLLEADSEYYNSGIVSVYQYEKMYVIRPQFFIQIITLLRNAGLRAFEYRQKYEESLKQNIDIANFEENMQAFKTGFARNYELASKQFKTAIDEIDKSIEHLQKIKESLTKSENNLRLANSKADDLSIKKLTKNAPSVAKLFSDAAASRMLTDNNDNNN